MACPEPSTLTRYKIGGQVADLCGEAVSVKVTVRAINPDGSSDPTNGAMLSSQNWQKTFTDGCWCTCDLLPNFSTIDDNLALNPNTSQYRIIVESASQKLVDANFYLGAEDLAGLTPLAMDGDCGDVINIRDILPITATVPPSTDFCTAVAACGDVIGATSVMTANADGSFTHSNGAGASVTIPAPGAAGGGLGGASVVTNPDGSVTVTGLDVNGNSTTATINPEQGGAAIVTNADGSITITGTDIAGNTTTATIPAAAAGGLGGATVVANADGSFTINAVDTVGNATTATIPAAAAEQGGGSVVANADGSFTVNLTDTAGNATTATIPDELGGATIVTNADGSITITGTDLTGAATTATIPAAVAGGSVSVLTDNGNGTYTHNDGNGTITTITAETGQAVVTTNADGSITIVGTDTAGTQTTATIPAPSILGLETPGGATYPDPDGDLFIQVGVEDQNGNARPFDTATGEWSVPVDGIAELGGAAPPAPTGDVTTPFTVSDQVLINGTPYVETQWVWDPVSATFAKVLTAWKDSVIDSDPYDAGVATAVGDHPATPLSSTDGLISGAWVTADGTGLTADVTVNVIVGGNIIGTAVIPAGSNSNVPVVATLPVFPVGFTGGATASFTVVGDGTAGEIVHDITVTYDVKG